MPEVGIELYRVIDVCGADAIEFLQGQLTQDVSLLATESHLLAAWCTAKGRVIVLARLASIDDGIAMAVPADMADKVLQMLLMFRFRSRVDLAVSDNDGGEWLESRESDPLSLIRAGIPHIDSLNSEVFTPHMLNLDKLGAISFTKGCYTGQEIVARTEHRGKSKRRMMHYLADREGISVGATVSEGGRSVGEVVNVAGLELLAVTPVDRHTEPLRVDDIVIRPQGLPYGL